MDGTVAPRTDATSATALSKKDATRMSREKTDGAGVRRARRTVGGTRRDGRLYVGWTGSWGEEKDGEGLFEETTHMGPGASMP